MSKDADKRLSMPHPKGTAADFNTYRSLRADKRKSSKTKKPIEAISEVAINTLESKEEKLSKVKRINSAPETANLALGDNNNVINEKMPPNRNSLRHDDECPPYDYSPNFNNTRAVHYISGHVNQAYVGQLPNVQSNRSILPNGVQREQYWSWPCCQQRRHWSRREKILSMVIAGQCVIICLLAVALLWVCLADGTIEKGQNPLYPWKL